MTTRTKIVATIGPSSSTRDVLRRMIDSGVHVFRLNFSHGSHEEHSRLVADIRTVSRELDRHVGILQDLCGPKMRLQPLPGDSVQCELNDEFTLVAGTAATGPRELACSYRELPNDLKVGEVVLFADGAVAMSVVGTSSDRARLRVTQPGWLRSRQGLNVPGSALAVSSLTEKDREDLDWTSRHAGDIDFVALSFVRNADDVVQLRRELRTRNCAARVVVKIEKPQAVEHLDEIITVSDAVMVARGDLGVEMDVQRVPGVQKRIIALCNQAYRPVITATQMLNSMEHSARPTRAEASDVFNAVLDGTDAVMLSGESAVGDYPLDAVRMMRDICVEAETYLKVTGKEVPSRRFAPRLDGLDPTTAAAVDAACLMTERLDAALIVVATDSGRSALALGNRRPGAMILALAHTEAVARKLSLCWGVTAIVLPDMPWAERVLAFGIEWAKAHEFVKAGQHAVLLRGHVADRPGIRAVLAGAVE